MNNTVDRNKVNLASYTQNGYEPGSLSRRLLWYLIDLVFFKPGYMVFSGPKRFFLRIFGAKVGKNVIIKPGVRIKYPWFLQIGEHVWIGENVWIDNLSNVEIEDHVCISQGAFLLCGNHDYKKTGFDLIVKPILIQRGAWIGARAIVCGGVTVETHAVLTVGSVAAQPLKAFCIYKGNPAVKIKERIIEA